MKKVKTRSAFFDRWVELIKSKHLKFYRRCGPYSHIFVWRPVKAKQSVQTFTPMTLVYYYSSKSRKYMTQFESMRAGSKLGLSQEDVVVINAATNKKFDGLTKDQTKAAIKLRNKMGKYCIKSKEVPKQQGV